MNTSAVPALHVQAVSAFQRQEWTKAYDLSVRLLADTPLHSASCYLAGLAAGELRNWPQALAHLQQATRQDPTNAEYAVQLAKSAGARVTATASGRSIERARSYGADRIID